mmetsp:Transcript_107561/g.273000  ORF Transcript_107561/g.273000 Transcript_107561/m.273000 type:complete len:234 (+) Transcript_107561:112-813(+)
MAPRRNMRPNTPLTRMPLTLRPLTRLQRRHTGPHLRPATPEPRHTQVPRLTEAPPTAQRPRTRRPRRRTTPLQATTPRQCPDTPVLLHMVCNRPRRPCRRSMARRLHLPRPTVPLHTARPRTAQGKELRSTWTPRIWGPRSWGPRPRTCRAPRPWSPRRACRRRGTACSPPSPWWPMLGRGPTERAPALVLPLPWTAPSSFTRIRRRTRGAIRTPERTTAAAEAALGVTRSQT